MLIDGLVRIVNIYLSINIPASLNSILASFFKNCDCFSSPKSKTRISWDNVMSSAFSSVEFSRLLLRLLPHDSDESRPYSHTACTNFFFYFKKVFIDITFNYHFIFNQISSYRFARSKTIFDVALEYNAVRFSKSECLVRRL